MTEDVARTVAKRAQSYAAHRSRSTGKPFDEVLPEIIRELSASSGLPYSAIERSLKEWHAELGEMGKQYQQEHKGLPKPKTETSEDADSAGGSFKSIFWKWAETNDIIPPDSALAHFAGISISLPHWCRSEMRKAGYEFERIGFDAGYKVTKRPAKRTTEIVLAELADAMKSGQQVRAASLIMELMELNKAA